MGNKKMNTSKVIEENISYERFFRLMTERTKKMRNSANDKLIRTGLNLSLTNYNKLSEISEKTSLSKREVIEALLSGIRSVSYKIVFIKEEQAYE